MTQIANQLLLDKIQPTHEWVLCDIWEEGNSKFSFHPKLAEWLRSYGLSPEFTRVYEIKCEEASCPVQETRIYWQDKFLQIGKNKESISKLDLQLAIQKQGFGNRNKS